MYKKYIVCSAAEIGHFKIGDSTTTFSNKEYGVLRTVEGNDKGH